jgi:type II secretory pathway component PulF
VRPRPHDPHDVPLPLEYGVPDTPASRRRFTSLPLTISLAVPTGLACIAAFLLVPAIERIAQELSGELPGVTRFVLRFARWVRDGYGWAILFTVPVIVPILLTQIGLAGCGLSRRSQYRMMRLVMAVLLAAVVLVMALALLLPLVNLVQSVTA